MNIAVKPAGVPSILTDWLRPETLLGRDLFDFGSDFFTPRLGISVPTVNIKETPKDFVFEVAAPGLERKDFNVEVDKHILKISVEKEEKKEEKENGYYKREYSFDSFCRTFTLPEQIKESSIDAKYENGILKVVVPKAKEAPLQPVKKITVG